MGNNVANVAKAGNVVVPVERGDITVSIESTGVIEPYERYDIVPLVKGNIVASPFEEGDSVKKGDLLYKFDDSDVYNNIQKSENALQKYRLADRTTQKDIEDQAIYAKESGRIVGLSIKEGDLLPATGGKICEIHKDDSLVVTIPFGAGQIGNIAVGDAVTLVSAENMGYLDGYVTYCSPGSYSGTDGSVLYDVEITADNPGSISKGDKLVAIVHTAYGDMESPQEGTVDIEKVTQVNATVGGEVVDLLVREGDIVSKGQKLVQLYNESLYDSQEKSELDKRDTSLTIDSQRKMLEDYAITSPIDGVVMKKTAKAGDNVGQSVNTTVLMTVGDLSRMVFKIKVDEVDIAKVALGQQVRVEADALPGQEYWGEVSNIATEGEATNGVTTYEVKVTINEPGELKPGMNVTSNIVVQSKPDVLRIPVAAVKKSGDKNIVYVKSDDEQKSKSTQKPQMQGSVKVETAPAGTVEREVELGINDQDNVEVLSGLSEGEQIVMVVAIQDSFSQMMGAGSGGQMDGPPPDAPAPGGGGQ